MKNSGLLCVGVGMVFLLGACRQICSVFEPSFAEKWCQEKIARHHHEVDTHFQEFQHAVKVAVRAEFSRVVGDCCCTGADLEPLESVPVPEAEFAVIKSILAAAKPAPYVEDDVLAPLDKAPKSKDEVPVEACRPSFINDALRLYDAQNECVYVLSDYHSIVRESEADAMRKSLRWSPQDEPIVLPDAALERFLALPSYQLFIRRQVDAFTQHYLPKILEGIQMGHCKQEDIERCKPKAHRIIYQL